MLLKNRLTLSKMMALATLVMVYFYYRHNTYCEPYMYSFFCLSEYSMVLINMAHHILGEVLILVNEKNRNQIYLKDFIA